MQCTQTTMYSAWLHFQRKILGIKNTQVLDVTMSGDGGEEGIGRIGDLEKTMTLEECCVYVKHRLKLGSLKVFGDMDKKVSRLAISPGSGENSCCSCYC